MGVATVAIFSEDDAASLHTRTADEAVGLKGSGPAAYLDIAQVVEAATAAGADAVHPGYGFLSENAAFARACEAAGLTFVGPTPATLELFGDKGRARALAQQCGVPVLAGTDGLTTLAEAQAFMAANGPVMVKAVAGGGGRGMRPASTPEELDAAFERCASEAKAAFGNGDLYVERFLARARHTEEVTGLDLVRLQLQIAAGRSLADLALSQDRVPAPRGHAVQARVNLETMGADGSAKPAGGVLSVYEPPSGPGVRVDGFGYAGYRTSARFDSLLAKLIVHAGAGGLSRAVAKAYRALSEFRIEGSATNIAFLQNLLAHPAVAAGEVHTRFIEEHMGELAGEPQAHPKLYFDAAARGAATPAGAQRVGYQVDATDPLAVLALGKQEAEQPIDEAEPEGPEGARPAGKPKRSTLTRSARTWPRCWSATA